MTPYGLGANQSPPDERDYQIADYGPVTLTVPPSYSVPKMPGVLDQGQSPECVAYSGACEQGAFNLVDEGHNYLWDEPYFFALIGGGPNGAVVRTAFAKRLSYGYPLKPANSGSSHAAHRIAAYYAVPVTEAAIKAAIVSYGPVVLGTPWYNSWFTPGPGAVLPPADYQIGGHAIVARGYTPAGLVLRNSWGAGWGNAGECVLPWAYLPVVWECWKAFDAKVGS